MAARILVSVCLLGLACSVRGQLSTEGSSVRQSRPGEGPIGPGSLTYTAIRAKCFQAKFVGLGFVPSISPQDVARSQKLFWFCKEVAMRFTYEGREQKLLLKWKEAVGNHPDWRAGCLSDDVRERDCIQNLEKAAKRVGTDCKGRVNKVDDNDDVGDTDELEEAEKCIQTCADELKRTDRRDRKRINAIAAGGMFCAIQSLE